MSESNRIAVLFEDLTIRREAIQYAAALAKRLDGGITLLMLLPNEKDTAVGVPNSGERGVRILEREAGHVAGAGIPVRHEVITGEPRSELIKYLATRPPFQAVVWGGGDRKAQPPGASRSTGHWTTAIQDELGCPFLVPARR